MKREQVIEYINQMLDKLPLEKLMMIYRILIRLSGDQSSMPSMNSAAAE